MCQLLRKSARYFAVLTGAALLLRLFFVFRFPIVQDDGKLYAELAINWLQHGIFGTTEAAGVLPSFIRLPGYPGFLAGVWAITGIEHYRAVLLLQVAFDLGTCFLTADMAMRVWRSDRAAKTAFLLAALCPFLANYTACVLPETLAIFLTTLTLDLALGALESGCLGGWAACGAVLGAGILVRPDGGILLPVIVGYLVARGWSSHGSQAEVAHPFVPWLTRAALVSLLALAPLVPWTVRNWRDFRVLQPLAPRYATAPDQFVAPGFQRWVKTWIVDYVSVSEVYWQIDGEEVDFAKLPSRAFDSAEERQAVGLLFAQYNHTRRWTPGLDHQLAEIAEMRIARHPLRYYLWLPAERIADMWLRPRTEMIRQNDRWWEVLRDARDAPITVTLGVLNLLCVGAATLVLGWLLWCGAKGSRAAHRGLSLARALNAQYWGLLLAFILVRSLFLGTLENPEPRYTLECYPVILVFAGAVVSGWWSVARKNGKTVSAQKESPVA
jgi:4-amino-4-deoxy-L-arabinose transferase-like glycosyltransferase